VRRAPVRRVQRDGLQRRRGGGDGGKVDGVGRGRGVTGLARGREHGRGRRRGRRRRVVGRPRRRPVVGCWCGGDLSLVVGGHRRGRGCGGGGCGGRQLRFERARHRFGQVLDQPSADHRVQAGQRQQETARFAGAVAESFLRTV